MIIVPLLDRVGEGELHEVTALEPSNPRQRVAIYTITFRTMIAILRFIVRYIF